jgi:hypothetical protein
MYVFKMIDDEQLQPLMWCTPAWILLPNSVTGNQAEVILVVIPGKESNALALLLRKCMYVVCNQSSLLLLFYFILLFNSILMMILNRDLSDFGLSGSMGYQLSSLTSVTYLWGPTYSNTYLLSFSFLINNPAQHHLNVMHSFFIVQWFEQQQPQRSNTVSTPSKCSYHVSVTYYYLQITISLVY